MIPGDGAVQSLSALLGFMILALACKVARAPLFAAHRGAVLLLVGSTLVFYASEFYGLLDLLLPSQHLGGLRAVGRFAHLSGTATALSLLASSRRELDGLRRAADTDALTSLLNPAAFRRLAGQRVALARLVRRPLALVLLDVDDFKAYNDRHGHAAGSLALERLARVLAAEVRAGDLLGRYGGEEFVVLLSADLDQALPLAERIRAAVAGRCTPAHDPALRRRLTISAGVAELGGGVRALEDLIEAADRELYRAKRAGKNQVWPTPDLLPGTTQARAG